jgi:glutamate--cysteine ligase
MPAPRPSLSVHDVRSFVDERCFPDEGSGGQIGAELEWLAVLADRPGRRAALATTVAALDGCVLPAQGRLTTEPGGQVELSSLPAPDLGTACLAVATDARAIGGALAGAGIALVGAGLDPFHRPRRQLDSPRYRAMEAFFDAGGEQSAGAGRIMMCNTASIQVNVDAHGPCGDRESRWRLAHDIGPVLAAAFANSPVAVGRHGAWRSGRLAAWQAIDRTRAAPALAGRGCVDDWSGYALAARVMMIRAGTDGFAPISTGLTFGRWIADGHDLGWPDADDLAYHLTTLFPPVRPKGWLELRMIDSLPDPWWRAAVAVGAALLDDPEAAAAAGQACAPVAGQWAAAARCGLADPAVARAAATCFGAALAALPRLGADPPTVTATEEYVERYVARGRCPADDAVHLVGAGR